MLVAAISPYHLTTREPAAMAALQLAEHAVTMLPTPFSPGLGVSRRDVGRAVHAAPEYLAFMESWSWAEPLFAEGVVGSVYAGEDAAADVRRACDRIDDDDRYGPLRPLMRRALFEDEAAYLRTIARDVLKAGPDPGVSIPVAAGLDAFAQRHGLVPIRPEASSLAQRAERRLATDLFALSLPVLLQASAERVLLARALLADEAHELGLALLEAIDAGGPVDAARAAADRFASAFDRERDHLLAPPGRDELDEVRTVPGTVTLRAVSSPADAVLRSSAEAAASIQRRAGGDQRDPGREPRHASLIVKVVGRRARG